MGHSTCVHCGLQFTPLSQNQRYCSVVCRRSAPKGPPLTCQHCGHLFRLTKSPRPGRDKFCSQPCYRGHGRRDRTTAPPPLDVPGAKWLTLGNGIFTLVDNDVYEWANLFKWYLGAGRASKPNSRYAVRSRPCGEKPHLVYLHREITGASPGQEVDHINENKLDNRRENLRVCTARENIINKSKTVNPSGYRGVFRKDPGWMACISDHGKRRYLGFFMDPAGAARAYDDAARQIQGDFACLNFPREGERGIRPVPASNDLASVAA